MRRIGILMHRDRGRSANLSDRVSERSCRAAAKRVGSIGRNVRIDYRWGDGDAERLSHARSRIWPRSRRTSSWPSATRRRWRRCCKRRRTVPIVFPIVADPVGAGFVASLGAAGRQRHRLSCMFEYGLSGKWLELLKEIAPAVTRVGGPAGSRHHRRDGPVRRDPGRGAVARGGGAARSTCATPARSSARSRLCALAEWRPDRDGERPTDSLHRDLIIALGGPAQAARDLLRTLLRRGRRP